MWKDVAAFEVRFHLQQALLPVSGLVFFALGLVLASSDVGTTLGDASGTTLRNAPIAVTRLMPVISLLGLFVVTAFVAGAALRDMDSRSDMLFFTKPLRKLDYLGGRFLGSMVVSAGVLSAGVLGLLAGNVAPWQPPDRLGPLDLGAYGIGWSMIIVPNLLMMGALFFALAVWSRRLTATYLCVVLFIGLQDAVEVLAQSLDSRLLGSMLDPSGVVAIETMARYWTLAEQNSRLPEMGGVLLANRLLWLGIAAVLLGLAVVRFDFTTRERKSRGRGGAARDGAAIVQSTASANVISPSVISPNVISTDGVSVDGVSADGRRSVGLRKLSQLGRQVKIEVAEILPGTPFLTLLGFGMLFVVAFSLQAGSHDGMPAYPLTELMLRAIQVGVRMSLVLILILYAGELVFSQRALEVSQVYDALPVSNGVFLAAKVLSLWTVVGTFLLAATTITVGVQLAKGHTDLNLALYGKHLAVVAWPLLLISVLAVFCQVVVNHKLLGLLLTAAILIGRFALPRVGLEDNLYLYASHPAVTYSGINGYGHHATAFAWYMIYWSFGACVLYALALLLWPRGTDLAWAGRRSAFMRRLTPSRWGVAAVGLAGMVLSGGWIYATTHLHGEYVDGDGLNRRAADYEMQYSDYRGLPLPRVVTVSTEVDIFPRRRQVEIRGRYLLKNSTQSAIERLPVTRSARWVEGVLPVYGGVTLEAVDLPPHTVEVADDRLGFYVYRLQQPLQPGQTLDFEFTVRVDHRAIANRRHNNLVVENGTFFSNRNFLPTIGYTPDNQLQDPAERRRRALPEIRRAASLDDASAAERNYLHADWIAFETILSTSADQTAIAPGRLVKEWTDGERNYFQYRTEAPVVHLLPYLSGRFEVVRESWQGVEIEIYYAADHDFNIHRFMDVTRRSLEYMTTHFGPYPHDQLRIVEVPNYHGKTAFAFAQTIAFSEAWAFKADVDGGDLDWLTAILAHEVAHQWWNHQVVPGDVQGATLIAESLAQYSAMMILRDIYGPQQVGRFLRFHLDRYLEQRGAERLREMPLARVENQGYVHYSKASLAFYALEDLIGEEALNGALREFLNAHRMAGPPYPTSRDLLAHIGRRVPERHAGVLDDLFQSITLFDQRMVAATYEERADGTFLVRLQTASHKLRDDGVGVTESVPLDDYVDIGVFGEVDDATGHPAVLILQRRRLQSASGSFSFVVGQRPLRAGIDPYFKLIDRDARDNVRDVIRVSEGAGS